MTDITQWMKNYAELAVCIGVNLQPGQRLVVSAPVEATAFVRLIAEQAYLHGASEVVADWYDDQLTRMKLQNSPDEVLRSFPEWKAQGMLQMARDGAAFLNVGAPDPALLQGIPADKVAAASRASAVALAEYSRMRRAGEVSWCSVSIPTEAWAKSVFPNLSGTEAVPTLWQYVFKATRSDLDEPVQAWRRHIDALKRRLTLLNEKQYRRLHYRATCTDLRVDLPTSHNWIGGGMTNPKGYFFTPNLPTEEVFTAPVKTGVNGTVRSTRPLNFHGNLIEGMSFTFRDGKVVDFSAEKGRDTLEQLFATDDGARYLGEVALVPQSSPIAQLSLIFNNTLYDENASCHMAFGSAYPTCIPGGGQMTREQLEQHGINTSLTHVDFMMGADDLEIDGETATGEREAIFRAGNWV